MSDDDLSMFEPYDDGGSGADPEPLRFGDPDTLWLSPPAYDGAGIAPAPRRSELLGDAEAAWWNDVATWTEWAIATFRLTKWLPPCWPRHPALVEEAQALWLLWCAAWMPGVEPGAPAGFLNQLGWALNRIETLWKIPCTASDHTEPTSVRQSHHDRPVTTAFWSNPDFDPAINGFEFPPH